MESTPALKLIVPLDGSQTAERALPAAIAIAGTDGEICLIRVVTPPDPFYDDIVRRYLPVTDQDHARTESDAHQSLIETAARYEGPTRTSRPTSDREIRAKRFSQPPALTMQT